MALEGRTAAAAALIGLVLAASAGCGGLRTRWQKVPVTSTPPGAAVFVDGRASGSAPVTIWLKRKARRQVVRIEAPGYDPVEIRSDRTANPALILVDVLLGSVPAWPIAMVRALNDKDSHPLAYTAGFGLLFTLIDAASGGLYDVKPKAIAVTLIKSRGEPTAREIVLAAEDMRNLTWIRVRRD